MSVNVTPDFVTTLIDQIGALAGDRRQIRELNGFLRYQLAGLSRGIIDGEISDLGIATVNADMFISELAAALNTVAKKAEDRDTSALLRRFVKVMETDYACVRAAHLRRVR